MHSKRSNFKLRMCVILLLAALTLFTSGCASTPSGQNATNDNVISEQNTQQVVTKASKKTLAIAKAIKSLSPISELSLKSKERVKNIRAKYESLSATQKTYLEGLYPNLEKAENRIKKLRRQARAEAERKAEEAAQEREQVAYITNTGSKYHNDGCQYLSKSKIETTIPDAESGGYTACSRCW